jgi:uncharacterized protein YqiB (DUF1249 family)
MVSDTLTRVSWRAKPRSFVALMALYESNYIRLEALAGTLKNLSGDYHSTAPGDCELVLKVTERCPYTTSFVLTYRLPGDPPEYPDMKVRIYHDARLVEAQEWALEASERELDQRWARNMMLNKWLEYCLERGHRFSSATEIAAAR